jgi:hypothetical protein
LQSKGLPLALTRRRTQPFRSRAGREC